MNTPSITSDVIENTLLCLAEYRDLLSVADLAEIFQVSKSTIYTEIKNGKFGTPITIGRSIKIPRLYIMKKFILDYQ